MKKIFLKVFFLLAAMIIIAPALLNFEAEAGTSDKEYDTYSNIWVLRTNKERNSNGNYKLLIKTYIKNNEGEYVESQYVEETVISYSSQPGDSSLTLESSYNLNRIELWKGSSKEIDTSTTSSLNTLNIQLLSSTTKTLKIFVEEKHNDLGYVNTNTSGGDIEFNKTVEPVNGKPNEFDLKFSVQGEAITKGKDADIILVLDKSGSMEDNISGRESKADVLEEAANRFIDAVLATNQSGNNRVAIVTYSDEAQIKQAFTTDKTAAKNAYKNFEDMVSGGTNSEAGFIKARELFGTSFRMGAERYVIYMTDGVPTQYYNINGEVDGKGNSYDINAKDAAISEANLLKNYGGSGVKIYTVGFASTNTSDMQALLNPSENTYQEAYYHATTANDLTNIYDIIADTIIDTIATNSVITDILPESFEFVQESLPEGVTVSEEGVMSCELGSITASESLKTVRIRYVGENYGIKYANEDAQIEYKHVLTPNVITEEKFENPLAIVAPNIAEYVYYTTEGESIVITPPDLIFANDAGSDYQISDLKIKVDEKPVKPNSTATANSDNTEITYVPQPHDYAEDKFSYIVYFTISSNTDPKNIIEGTSQIIEKKVNVIVNPKPDVKLTINYYETLDDKNRALSINGATSINKYLPNNGFIDEIAPSLTGYNLIDISYEGIINPLKVGRRLTGQAGSNNVTINFYYERDSSIVFDNILQKNSMYAQNELKPIGNSLQPFEVVMGIKYRFGFKFQNGQNVDKISVSFTGDADDFILSDFMLYDQEDNLVGGPFNDFNSLDSLTSANNIYTLTYNVKPVASNSVLNVLIDNVVKQNDNVVQQLEINSIKTFELE
ncbi:MULTISPECIES: vWA domain-containing protein [unclassified Sedimentibacter]|uniref:vWA domain-containing protein n=1 Tax=unclassified Sedimentibacter TaxID=2649220 RepID=UPI0027E08AF5|nr:vWA domain-containing protein [Sedimentibacter sp. MB35-C1]WMJ76668.1 vWA domain-containing protein [Sedimentibacter sp. MB35-C1]